MGTGTTLVFARLKNTRANSVQVVGTKTDFVNAEIKNNTTIMNTAPSSGKTHHKKTRHFRKSTSNSIFATFNVNFEARRKYIVVLINKRPVKFQFDTASDITLISRSTWKLLGKPTLKDTNVACSASVNKIQLTGELICDVSFKEKMFRCIYITDSSNLNLLGLDFIEELDLFKVLLNSIFNTFQVNSAADTDKHLISILKTKFNNVFQEGLGCCTKVKATLKLKSDSKPIFRPKRPVPYAALATVENEINRLQQGGVIQPINYSSWAAPIVMVKKANGKVRLCADFST